MSFSERQFREAVKEILESNKNQQEQLFQIMEQFRDAQYDMLSGVSVTSQHESEPTTVGN